MTNLTVAAIAFLLLHLVVSGTRVRDVLVQRIGARAYMGLFSLASVVGLVWLIFAFSQAVGSAADKVWWSVTPVTRWIQLVLQAKAIFLVVIGLSTPNPTSVGQEGAVDRPVTGILRITRHPFLWGVGFWSVGHILVNGNLAGLILFGTMLVLAVFGTIGIDAKRRRALGERWQPFANVTSNIPYAAILGGRQQLKLGEIGWWRYALATVVYVALLFGHPYAFGFPALPPG